MNEIEHQLREWADRAQKAQAAAAQAYDRLLSLAEQSDSGQARRVAQFVAATFNGNTFRFDLFDLRAVDVEISDDMLLCLDALRWGKADLWRLIPNGDARITELIASWNLKANFDASWVYGKPQTSR